MMQWFAQAPANIALIKYMGKKGVGGNLPDNPSLSYTLNNLLSTVKLELSSSKKDFWEPLTTPGVNPLVISDAAQKRFIEHLVRIKDHFDYQGGFIIRSSNNFPLGSGLASSASSFAALTKCAVSAMCELTQKALPSLEEQAQLSRLGSGSSCRSFFSPWALWQGDEVKAISLPYQKLIHQVVVISHQEKSVSSSEAHRRVKSSPDYATRPARAEQNLKSLLNALETQDWTQAYHICWTEFQDMHHLFSTAEEPFRYMTEASNEVLNHVQDFWESESDGPIVTMDAGPNIHLLYRPDQEAMAARFKQTYLVGNYDLL